MDSNSGARIFSRILDECFYLNIKIILFDFEVNQLEEDSSLEKFNFFCSYFNFLELNLPKRSRREGPSTHY